MKKLLLLTSILTIMFTSFGFAKTYSIKKEKEGEYVEISQSDIEVVLSKGKKFAVINTNKGTDALLHIMIYDKKMFYCLTQVYADDVKNSCRTWESADSK